jgi:hypothetical protein
VGFVPGDLPPFFSLESLRALATGLRVDAGVNFEVSIGMAPY